METPNNNPENEINHLFEFLALTKKYVESRMKDVSKDSEEPLVEIVITIGLNNQIIDKNEWFEGNVSNDKYPVIKSHTIKTNLPNENHNWLYLKVVGIRIHASNGVYR